MANGEVIVRFDNVSFARGLNKPILDEVDFSVRRGAKITLMGQNGAGKSTIFQLILGILEPDLGFVHCAPKLAIAAAKQTIPRGQLGLTVREFFEKCFAHKVYELAPGHVEALKVVILGRLIDPRVNVIYLMGKTLFKKLAH